MGVDAKLLINARHGVGNVVKVLEAIGAKEITENHKSDHSFVNFKWYGEERMMYVARSFDYGGIDGTLLSLSQWGAATEILTRIAKITGGFLCEQDCYDKFQMFQDPHQGFAKFILEHQILHVGLTDSEELADAVAEATGYERTKL